MHLQKYYNSVQLLGCTSYYRGGTRHGYHIVSHDKRGERAKPRGAYSDNIPCRADFRAVHYVGERKGVSAYADDRRDMFATWHQSTGCGAGVHIRRRHRQRIHAYQRDAFTDARTHDGNLSEMVQVGGSDTSHGVRNDNRNIDACTIRHIRIKTNKNTF